MLTIDQLRIHEFEANYGTIKGRTISIQGIPEIFTHVIFSEDERNQVLQKALPKLQEQLLDLQQRLQTFNLTTPL